MQSVDRGKRGLKWYTFIAINCYISIPKKKNYRIMCKGSIQWKEGKRCLSFLELTREVAVFSALAAHTCSWIIARLGTEIAACGHDPKDQEDTHTKKNPAQPWAKFHCMQSRSTIYFWNLYFVKHKISREDQRASPAIHISSNRYCVWLRLMSAAPETRLEPCRSCVLSHSIFLASSSINLKVNLIK